MVRTISEAQLAGRIVEQGLWGNTPFFLLDVGASGGIDAAWSIFGARLKAIGFDPLVAEVNRLNRVNEQRDVRYEAAFVGARDYDALFPPELRSNPVASKSNDPWSRVSAIAAQQQLKESYVQEVFNAGAPVVFTDRRLVLDDFVPRSEYPSVDFLKIDTDGHDIEVLLGAEEILTAGGVLGMSVEVQHHGAVHAYANTFDNIDRLLRSHGFTLFDLEPNRYSRTALPAPFVLDLAAQTESGQVLWSEALYFRDLGDPTYERKWSFTLSRERILKLASLFDMFSLADCAAELLLNRAPLFDAGVCDALLDLLAGGSPGAYREFIADIRSDFRSLYPSRRKPTETQPTQTVSVAAEDDSAQARKRAEKFQRKNRMLRERLRQRKEQLSRLSQRVKDLKAKLKQ